MDKSYNLDRFIDAQNSCYEHVLIEIENGEKRTHWMWFIFPQIAGLGRSSTAVKYEIINLEEAKAYLSDSILSKRLLELTKILAYHIDGKTAEEIFGFPDCMKFHSSMTLFKSVVSSSEQFKNHIDFNCFEDVIKKYYNGESDRNTIKILEKS